jgi:hypothetical protein
MSPASSPSDELLSTPALRHADEAYARLEDVWKLARRRAALVGLVLVVRQAMEKCP